MKELDQLHEFIKSKKEETKKPKKATSYYLSMFKAYDGFPRFASWNWPAFLFGGVWMIYRKMYWYGFFALLYSFFEIASPILRRNTDISSPGIIGWVVAILFGLFGNSIYRYHLRKRVSSNSSTKGTNTFGAVVAAIIVLAIIVSIIILSIASGLRNFEIPH